MNITDYSKSLCSFLVFAFICAFGFAQSIYTNPITGTNPNTSNPYTTGETHDANITVSGISRGSGISGANANDRYNANGWNLLGRDVDDYFEFTLTPNACYQIDFVSFVYTSNSTSLIGPASFSFRSSEDGFSTDIGTPNASGTTIDLSAYQNITESITFRFYAWGGLNLLNGYFSINDFTFNGVVSPISTTTWGGSSWDNGAPDSSSTVIINGNYDTSTNGNITACNLTVNPSFELVIGDNTYVEVENNLVVDGGSIAVQSQGALVQNGTTDEAGTFSLINSGTATLNKFTRNYYDDGLHYTYWGSPVENANIVSTFPDPADNRRYWFNAANYLDQNTVGTTNGIPDDIDDDGNDWQKTTGTMTAGLGYAITAAPPPPVPFPYPYNDNIIFSGGFNTGDIEVTIYRNDAELADSNWNLLGNPYPCAISTDAFFDLNGYDATTNPTGIIENILYLWTHNSPASASNPGNQVSNFSQDDYAVINLSGGTAAVSGGEIPNKYIPSCQGFFVAMDNDAPTTGGVSPVLSNKVVFTNEMRVADGTSNSQFFKDSYSKEENIPNKLWVDLTSNNGAFNQILVAYLDGATDGDDGLSYDAKKLISGNASILYSIIDGSDKKFVIQGKASNSLKADETIQLGFVNNIDASTEYTLSITQLQGDFVTNNIIYLKDNLFGKIHNLSDSNYTFTSSIGQFDDRFVLMFNNETLSSNQVAEESNELKIIDLDNSRVEFTAPKDLRLKNVSIYDITGRKLYDFKGQYNSEVYNISSLRNTIYIAKVLLSNNVLITKKRLKSNKP
ncbi:hypothetical protein KO566_08370 [Flavobacteriaceae bacterium XHP0103]|uniref:hypothetical protein n=1 Tax=Marixanthotalea marina TaxID=2844359 RepID=UPI002989DEF2|nr:hypothetical protein [Marixanthotalea marina]MBU3822071.1 hypothetical protein [Marixanthotalea marina]